MPFMWHSWRETLFWCAWTVSNTKLPWIIHYTSCKNLGCQSCWFELTPRVCFGFCFLFFSPYIINLCCNISKKDRLDQWDFILVFCDFTFPLGVCITLVSLNPPQVIKSFLFLFWEKMLLCSSVDVKFGYFYVPERLNLYFTLQSFSAVGFNAGFSLSLENLWK